ncbi:hypothetical protein CO058_04210 [candidate division WWE3 bacterium CG_4_9_14_0_2_um_filter_35_11]|uniref:DUF883 domain-containing protein n=2 Tax=Bacteria candidate phyla TaxID=1783234 RepID=A0A2M6P1C6_9BACT|nr:MAG: hypothetical protein COU30_02250 [Candidatus Magasanikbacteria bacterium CG10_big_fil_rev_8_21_14_0_10_38_6]PJC23281.1 MAG: hypothetical protein CO058_04210 [candidate division WWE3 bacterium CG_4_9_14_0_2_um_filter_35_11]
MARKNNDASELKSRLSEILNEVEELGSDEVGVVRDTLDEYLKRFSDRANEMKQDVQNKAIDVEKQTDEYVGEHPWHLAVYSIAIGVLMGLLLTKSSSKK